MTTGKNDNTLISESELRDLGKRAFQNLGLSDKDVEDVVDILVMADLFDDPRF
jgi:LDH2 family malate/lactate/ureidoglycolate dehydrogenase